MLKCTPVFALVTLALGSLFGFFSAAGGNPESHPEWFQHFKPKREFYVSSKGDGSGKSKTEPTSFTRAIETAKEGDLFWLLPDTYSGNFVFRNPGNASHPIVFRALPGARVVIEGSLQIKGAYNWIWGLEVTDSRKVSKEAGITLFGPGMRLINNIVHHHEGKSGINAWNLGSGQILYGNIVFSNGSKSDERGHNLYIQNDFEKYGYKYIVNNMFLDSGEICNRCFNFHAYGKEGILTGLHIEKNIIANGRFLVGGYGEPAEMEIVRENYFYDAQVQFGYRRPTQVRFENNYLGRSNVSLRYFWGAGETKYRQREPNIFRGNQILFPPGPHLEFITSAYLDTGRCEGCAAIRSEDSFDNNQYSAPFHAVFHANNQKLGKLNFSEWKNATSAAGNSFDSDSVILHPPIPNKIILLPNAYDPDRVDMAIYNWEKQDSVTVVLAPVFPPDTPVQIYPARNLFAKPIASGISGKPVTIPLDGAEFSAFIVIRNRS